MEISRKVRIAGIEPESIVDGPGIRYSIFLQGCKHKCKGCHNPETWDFRSGSIVDIDKIVDDLVSRPYINGVTISGGDPFYQLHELEYLVHEIKRRTGKNIWVYTGFKFDELIKNKDTYFILNNIDVLIDGPFILNERNLSLKFRGSRNQRLIDMYKTMMIINNIDKDPASYTNEQLKAIVTEIKV